MVECLRRLPALRQPSERNHQRRPTGSRPRAADAGRTSNLRPPRGASWASGRGGVDGWNQSAARSGTRVIGASPERGRFQTRRPTAQPCERRTRQAFERGVEGGGADGGAADARWRCISLRSLRRKDQAQGQQDEAPAERPRPSAATSAHGTTPGCGLRPARQACGRTPHRFAMYQAVDQAPARSELGVRTWRRRRLESIRSEERHQGHRGESRARTIPDAASHGPALRASHAPGLRARSGGRRGRRWGG